MTPQERHAYKLQWLMNYKHCETIHSDREFDAKRWCKQNLEQHQWHYAKYTDVYEDTVYFETQAMMQDFVEAMK